MIRIDPPVTGTMFVGVDVGIVVTVGEIWVDVAVSVLVSGLVAAAVGNGKVGNGVNVTGPKLNKAVGVASIPCVGKTPGLGVIVDGSWERKKRRGNEQSEQNASRIKIDNNILPVRPCWLKIALLAETKEFIRFSIFLPLNMGHRAFYPSKRSLLSAQSFRSLHAA